ncbi:mandelate racemase/muconate lactonizing enzyme family protein [Cocleimonas sp. KMM 6892]|uniref:mandelate racemase/muconate lactonizing enzyme family protein n=1 Tax=unclassified Cocleimonas TaxID=2639732 RepID=UPI002DB6FA4A|nr:MULTISPECIES: mandelate racemase/muconate lactonizing enzyme family protein [unclassified Cocleimonas]MEB8432682.1 mandelate racemase/muconate lactonizing enzyme family protein [Cocleimonas sp. KMM 6892]MEC4715541.1 mandelate racemase/muconate lactonizing enzyme family protein [Cocleimonas sp. KMM 6895]MEC4744841.1 mandelate racemase/muconate lactonizing enzyme family protein [Cocleimonas sp. KMM 6896]
MINPHHKDLDLSITIKQLDVVIKRFKIETPVKTSFGTMTERPAVFVRIQDDQGAFGYGEIWCNFPACGADHRAKLFASEIIPRVQDKHFDSPRAAFEQITNSMHILALQTGEFGPIAQAICGLDIAIWDLVAKRHDISLHNLLNESTNNINVYASGINPKNTGETVAKLQAMGHSRFKLKIGFGKETDLNNLQDARDTMSDGQELMVDVNQAWDIETALNELPDVQAFNPRWIEEPLRKDSPLNNWIAFKKACTTNVAGGENFDDMLEFDQAIDGNWMDIFQPDVCKWGGISKGHEVAVKANQSGKVYCPHSLGGGIALAASAHILAASGSRVPGVLEVDNNHNPLREDVFPITPVDGQISLVDLPGLGVETDVLDHYFKNPD